jgi:5,10-methylenetetrahydrofolate reductase
MRAVELRPPRVGLTGLRSVDAWIDLNQALRSLLRSGRFVLFTDDAVGDAEEESLQHLTSNLGAGHDLSRVVPFLTCKHSLDYCLMFARRAASHGLEALTVTGGDHSLGPPRCVPHSRDLRRLIREQVPELALGAWANPFRDPIEQVEVLLDPEFGADYLLTQVVSHHAIAPLERFLETAAERGLRLPILVGVFFYRSGSHRTLERLGKFIPVPAEALIGEFDSGLTPEAVCARSLTALKGVGVEKVYLSNLEPRRAEERLRRIEPLA